MSQNEDRKVRFNDLKSSRYVLEAEFGDVVFQDFKNEEIKGGKVHFDITGEQGEGGMMFNFVFEGEVRVECDRCLCEMNVGIKGEEWLNVRFSDDETTDEEDTVILPENASEIDLTPWMYEYVAVRIPMQHTHPDGECDPEMLRYLVSDEGDAAGDGTGETDPRWDALKELK